jgi:hypothetical protein
LEVTQHSAVNQVLVEQDYQELMALMEVTTPQVQ